MIVLIMLATHEIEILQGIKCTAENLANDKARGKVSQGDIVAAAMRRNPTRTSPRTMMALTKFYIGFLENDRMSLIKDLIDLHAHTIDPKELCVSISFFELLVSEEALKTCPESRMALVYTQYTSDKVRFQAGGPSVSAFLETNQIVALCKKPESLMALEGAIKDIKDKHKAPLVQCLGEVSATLALAKYTDLIIRCIIKTSQYSNTQ